MSTDELAQLRVDYDRLQAEHIRMRDQMYRRERDLREWEKRVVSARRREQQDWLDNLASGYAAHRANAADRGGLHGVFRLIRELPDRPKPTEVGNLRRAALVVENAIKALVTESPEQFYDRHRAEVKRLRAYIRTTGQKLHAAHGQDVTGPTYVGCTCPGCELIVGMDVLGDDEPAPIGEEQEITA